MWEVASTIRDFWSWELDDRHSPTVALYIWSTSDVHGRIVLLSFDMVRMLAVAHFDGFLLQRAFRYRLE